MFCYFKFVKSPTINIYDLKGINNLSGKTVDLSQYKGKPLVLGFWASWCPPCRKELPNLELLKQEMGERVNIILLSDESLPIIKRFSMSRQSGVIYLQSAKRTSYDIYSIPTTYFYDSNGKLVNSHRGYLDKITLNKLYKEIE